MEIEYERAFRFLGRTVAGTTDTPTKLTFSPKPTKSEVQFILDEIKDYLSEDITGT
jgi:glycerol-3-phosphate dehydrogenase